MKIHNQRADFLCRGARGQATMAVLFAAVLTLPQPARAWDTQYTKLVGVGADVGTRSQQGRSVALSDDGGTLIVGGPFTSVGVTGNLTGAAWVFTRKGKSWSQEAILTAPNKPSGSQSGWSVGLSRDGDTAIVGVPGDFGFGSAMIFTRRNGRWSFQASLNPMEGIGNLQGRGVSISDDGNTVIISSAGRSAGSVSNTAYIYARNKASAPAGGWALETKLVASSQIAGAVALSGDGDTALLGGSGDVFHRQKKGQWTQAGTLAQTGAVALNRSGDTAIVSGSATLIFQFRRGAWRQIGQLGSGASVALSRNAHTALVGDPYDNGGVGAAWLYTRWKGVWRQQGPKLVGGQAIGLALQGYSVSLSGNGDIAAVGGPNDNPGEIIAGNFTGGVGATWLYQRAFDGTPEVASCYAQSVTALTTRFGGLNTAAWSLGYGMANVEPLQSAIHAYCDDDDDAKAQTAQAN